MKPIDATVILPQELIEQLQQFVQGGTIYIPASKDDHPNMGEATVCRKEMDRRNSDIIQAYTSGASVEQLAESYLLSIYAIREIINHYTLKM